MKRQLIAMALIWTLLVAQSPALADQIQLLQLKKDTVMGMKDGAMSKIPASEVAGVQGPYTVSGIFIEFSHQGTTYRLKASDTNIKVNTPRTCLPGEKKVAEANTQIGATQMGSGESGCVDP